MVIGGGMAGLCAAITARRTGATVVVLEAAREHMRGGNLRHARNIRIPHARPTVYSPGVYDRSEFERELTEVSQGQADRALIARVAASAADLTDWLSGQGVVFQTKHIPPSRRTAFFLGGGKAVTNALFKTAESLGIEIRYRTAVDALDMFDLPARTVVLCCGGGQAAGGYSWVNRGTPFNTGVLTERLIRAGAAECGEVGAAHVVAVDARSPRHDGGIVTRIDGMALGMMVDRTGRRFVEEDSISGSRRYAVWGQTIAALPEPRAVLVVDAAGMAAMPVLALAPIRASSLAEMADFVGVDPSALLQSARECGRVREPPFHAYPVVPGITFSCHGLHVDQYARVRMRDGTVRQNLFAAGANMAAGVLHTGYLSGAALTISAVFGRIAGEEAARHALG
jgi:tricarballylate dehydrogenase